MIWNHVQAKGMLNKNKKTFHFPVFLLIQITCNIGLEGRESDQQARWNAENGQKEPETMPGMGNLWYSLADWGRNSFLTPKM